MASQSFRTRKIFETANTFRSDHELWPLLEEIAMDLFGVKRTAELLLEVNDPVSYPSETTFKCADRGA